MQPLERSNLVDQTEAALLAGIRAGQWKGTLPGVRMLCKVLQISSPTLKIATNRLLQRGVLVSKGPRRRFEISPEIHSVLPRRSRSAAGERTRRVLCLTDNDLPQMTHHRLQTLSRLRLECPHWDLRHHVVPSTHASGHHQQWDRLLDIEKPDAMVIFGGRPAIAQWSHERHIPTVFVGGDHGQFQLPIIGASPLGPVADSLAALIQQGHHDICMPMFDLSSRVVEAQRNIFRTALEKAGHHFDPSWNTPSAQQKDPDVMLNTLTLISRTRLPTAIIAMSWEELVAVLSFLQSRRLAIPHDVSIISLGTSSSGIWFRPKITHFEYSIARIIRNVKRWIDHDFPPPTTRLIIPSRMIRGESVAKPSR